MPAVLVLASCHFCFFLEEVAPDGGEAGGEGGEKGGEGGEAWLALVRLGSATTWLGLGSRLGFGLEL